MKKLLLFFLILVLFSACKSSSNMVTSKNEAIKRGTYSERNSNKTKLNEKKDYGGSKENSRYLVKRLINTASDNLGAKYRAGGITPQGFDCSGLVYATFLKFDIVLPRSSVDMAKIGTKIDSDDIQKGDLIFFKTNGKSVINHVGLVTEVNDDEIKFIHSSTQKGVIVSSTKEPYYKKTFAQANRISL